MCSQLTVKSFPSSQSSLKTYQAHNVHHDYFNWPFCIWIYIVIELFPATFLGAIFFYQWIVTPNAFRIFQHEIAVAESKNVKGLSYSYQNDAYKPSEVSWEEIPYENLKLLDELGSGAFGVVYKAEYLQENGNVLPCAVKSLKRESGIPYRFL